MKAHRSHPRRSLLLPIVVLALALTGTACAREADTAGVHYEAARRGALVAFGNHYVQGRMEAAADVARAYLEATPCDPVMEFNLACALALAGERAAAEDALRRAVAHGYPRFDSIRRDDDLLSIGDAVLEAIAAQGEAQLLQARERATVEIVEGAWSASLPLRADQPDCAGDPIEGAVRMRSTPDGLQFAIDVDDVTPVATLLVGVPEGTETFQTRRHRVFRGAVDAPLSFDRWNGQDTDLPPWTSSVARDGDRWVHTIAWDALEGIGPPLDPDVAFNVQLADPSRPRASASVVSDPFLGSRVTLERRHGVVRILPGDPAAPWFRGRLASSLVIGDSLEVDFVVQGLPEVDAVCRVEFVAADARVATPPIARTLFPDIDFFDARFDVSGLTPGLWTLEAMLVASDDTLRWNVEFLRLETGWRKRTALAIEEHVASLERATVFLRANRVGARAPHAFAAGPVRDLARWAAEAESMIVRARRTGSVFPPVDDTGAAFEAAVPLVGDAALPVAWFRDDAGGEPGDARIEIVDPERLAHHFEPHTGHEAPGTTLVVALEDAPGNPSRAPAILSAAFAWFDAVTASPIVHVAAEGAAAEPALRWFLQPDVPITQLHVDARADFAPWRGQDPEDVVSSLPADLSGRLVALSRVELPDGAVRRIIREARARGLHIGASSHAGSSD